MATLAENVLDYTKRVRNSQSRIGELQNKRFSSTLLNIDNQSRITFYQNQLELELQQLKNFQDARSNEIEAERVQAEMKAEAERVQAEMKAEEEKTVIEQNIVEKIAFAEKASIDEAANIQSQIKNDIAVTPKGTNTLILIGLVVGASMI